MEYRENRDARRPFLSTPDSRVYFPASAIERARRATARCLRRSEGVALVVGATGVGKTLLTRVLAAEFEADSLVAVVAPTRRIDVKSFWQQFLFGLRQTFCGCDETELRLMALDYLERSSRRRCVLLIDDAQRLPFRVFDELRSFVDQGAAAASQVCVALFGTPVLEERLNLPPLYPFQQRIASRSYLDAFERDEIAGYIDRETERVGGGFLFTGAAKRRIAELSEGSPRIANQLCDRALFLTGAEDGKIAGFDEGVDFNGFLAAANGSAREIDAPLVDRAWANLLNLPEERPESSSSGLSDVVEFGTLDDEDEDYNGFNVWRSGETASFDAEEDPSDAALSRADEASDEENAAEEERADEEKSESGEVDAELEARLLQNVTIWETARKNDLAEEANAVENFERDEFTESKEKEKRADFSDFAEAESDERVGESNERFGLGESAADRSTCEIERKETLESAETAETIKLIEATEANEPVGTNETLEIANETAERGADSRDAASECATDFSQDAEKRVFEALKSEYFNSGFLFELPDDGDAERKLETSRKPRAKTRRPISSVSEDRLFDDERENASDERFWEMRTTARNVGGRSVSDAEAARGEECEFASPEDLAYAQILDDCFQTANEYSASDEYLNELSLLEQEIAEEANLIRRIRNIHLKLRSARAERRRRRNADEENNVAPSGDGEKTLDLLDKWDDAAVNS